jgi:hypothetical protein
MDIRLSDRDVILAACEKQPLLLSQLVGDDLVASERVTMLWQACAIGDKELAECLIAFRKYCDPNFQRESDGVSCLYIAAQNGHDAVCSVLVASGANVNVQRNSHATPLFIATQRNHAKVVSVLLRCNADCEIKNDQKCSPFVLACNMGHTSIALLLLEHGCKLSSRGTGIGPLLWCKKEKRLHTFDAVTAWISSRHLEPMIEALQMSLLASRWAVWKAAASQLRDRRLQVAKDAADAAEKMQAFVLEGGPLPSLNDLMEFEFSGKLRMPIVESVTPERPRANTLAPMSQREHTYETPRSQRLPNVLDFLSPSPVQNPNQFQRRSMSKLPPSLSKTYERQQKIRELVGSSADTSALFADALCTQHFR